MSMHIDDDNLHESDVNELLAGNGCDYRYAGASPDDGIGPDSRITIPFAACNPLLRTINLYPCASGFDTGDRVLFNPYLLYVHAGRGRFRIGDTLHEAEPGDLYHCPAGVVQRIIADRDEPFLLTGIDFDWTRHHEGAEMPWPTTPQRFEHGRIPRPLFVPDLEQFPVLVRLPGDEPLREMLLTILEAYDRRARYWEVLAGGLLKCVLAVMMQAWHLREAEGRPPEIDRRLGAVIRYLAAHHGPGITCAAVAARFHYHPDHLSRRMVRYAGMSLKQYLTGLRIREAITLLRYSDRTITEIAEQTGFSSPAHFSRTFRLETGHPPSALRRMPADPAARIRADAPGGAV